MEKNKKIVWLLGIFCVLLAGFWGGRIYFFEATKNFKKIKLGAETFLVEVAKTPEERKRGLSGRKELCDKCGMLFVFAKEDYRQFWMKDMQFNLDILWLKGEKILNISPNISYVQGSREEIRSKWPADRVLEIKAGESARLGLKIGDEIKIEP
jgi:uncharacterized membrane protein (UPF0127 family)